MDVITIGVVIRRRALSNPWQSHVWEPYAILPDLPETEPGTRLPGGEDLVYAGPATIPLHAAEAPHHLDNISAETPVMWIVLRGADGDAPCLVAALLDPYEGEALAGDPDLAVETLPLPDWIVAALADFCLRHPRQPVFEKRRREGLRQGPRPGETMRPKKLS